MRCASRAGKLLGGGEVGCRSPRLPIRRSDPGRRVRDVPRAVETDVAAPTPSSSSSSVTTTATRMESLERIFRLQAEQLLMLPPGAGSEEDEKVAGDDGAVGVRILGMQPLQVGMTGPKLEQQRREEDDSSGDSDPEFCANVGDALWTLRSEIPCLFAKDLTYDIYRDDVVFRDPRNCFRGIKNYKLIFWSLRFHGKIFFKNIFVEVKSLCQMSDREIRMRWTVHGMPRIPWETEGTFDGVSTYKLDKHGKIYEHMVDNVIFKDPPVVKLPIPRLVLSSYPQQPCPGAWFQKQGEAMAYFLQRFSWFRLYMVLLLTVQLVNTCGINAEIC